MASFEEIFGGAIAFTVTADLQLPVMKRVVTLVPTSGGHEVSMPDATRYTTGGPIKYLINKAATAISVDIVDKDGGALFTLDQDKAARMFLVDNSTSAGTWLWDIRDTTSISGPPATGYLHTIGGETDTSRAWEYDHTVNTWASRGDSAITISSAPAFLADGNAYALESLTAGTPAVRRFNSPNWDATVLAACTRPHRDGGGAGIGSDGYVTGHPTTQSQSTQMDAYDSGGDSWSLSGTDSLNFRFGSVRAVGSLVYKLCGNTGAFFASWSGSTTTRSYNPGTSSFTALTAAPTNRANTASFVLGSSIHLAGGKPSDAGSVTDRHDEYDTVGDSWTNRTAYPNGATDEPAGAGVNSQGHVMGGSANLSHSAYAGGSWTSKASHPVSAGTTFRDANNSTLTVDV